MRSLKTVLAELGVATPGWTLRDAWDVTPDGMTIVGMGTNPTGFSEAFVAHVPEPATGLLVLLCGGALMKETRRRRN